MDGRTDGPTDGRTNRRTDGWTDRPTGIRSYRDARTHLKRMARRWDEDYLEAKTEAKSRVSMELEAK